MASPITSSGRLITVRSGVEVPMVVYPAKSAWKDHADAVVWVFVAALTLVSAPLRIIYEEIRLRARTRHLVRGRIEDAWQRCTVIWQEGGLVCQSAAHHGAAFGHVLAVALARHHRSKRAFFLAKVADSDPLLAAYGFKCLIRMGKVHREELPAGSLQRSAPIRVLWADLVSEESVGAYFEGWFLEQEHLLQLHVPEQAAAPDRDGV